MIVLTGTRTRTVRTRDGNIGRTWTAAVAVDVVVDLTLLVAVVEAGAGAATLLFGCWWFHRTGTASKRL